MGLLADRMGASAAAPEAARQEPARPAQGEMPPERKEQYQRILAAAVKSVSQPEVIRAVVDAASKGDPVQAMAQIALVVIGNIAQQAPFPKEMYPVVAMPVVAILADTLEKTGHPVPQEAVAQAAQAALAQAQQQFMGQQDEQPETQPEEVPEEQGVAVGG